MNIDSKNMRIFLLQAALIICLGVCGYWLVNSFYGNHLFQLIFALVLFSFALFVIALLWWFSIKRTKLQASLTTLSTKNNSLQSENNDLEKLVFLVNEIEQAIAIVGKDDCIEWVNKSFVNKLQYSEEEVVGCKLSSILGGSETDLRVVKKMDESIFTFKRPIDSTILQYKKDGTCYWARVYLTPLLDQNKELDKYVAISLDITKEKETNELLKQSESNIRKIGETIEDMVYLYNLNINNYEYISPKCRSVLGANQSFFYAGQDYVSLNVLQSYQSIVREAKAGIIKGKSFDIEYEICVDNEYRWIRERSYPIHNDKGEIIKQSGICSDITILKKEEAKFNRIHQNIKLLTVIGNELTKDLSIVKIIETVFSEIKKIMDADGFGIGIINHTKNEIRFPEIIETNGVYKNVVHSLNDNILANVCIKEKKEIIINNFNKEIGLYIKKDLEATSGNNPLSLIYIRLEHKNETIGLITVQSLNEYAYNAEQIDLLRSLSVTISNALVNAQLYESLEKRVDDRTQEVLKQAEMLEQSNKDIELLSQIGLDISSSIKFEEIFEKLYKNVNTLMDAEAFAVRIFDKDSQLVHYKYEIESGKRHPAISIPFSDKNNYTVWCIENRKELVINDNKKEYHKYVDKISVPEGEMPHSLLFWPMIVDDEVIGVVTTQSFKRNAYDLRHQNILKTLTFYSGIALSNAALYETLESKVEERTIELSKKTREIVDSINYAKNIQFATLTSKNERLKHLPKSFVYYQPKDIVSGDFFRVDSIDTRNNQNLVAFVVADCTGHGVPGASLAMLCNSIIKQAISDSSVFSPSDALEYSRNELNIFLESSNTKGQDGMDLSFCVWDKDTNILYFAGAFSDCIIFRGDVEFILRGDRRHVGYQETVGEFNTIEFQLKIGDLIYLTTDGFLDQFGGAKDKKFTRKRFLSLIHEIKDHEINEQKELLKNGFINWKGKNEQTDDICVMGIEVC